MDLQYNPLLRDNLQYSGGNDTPAPTYDDALSDTSENAVQNRIITEEITKITDTQTKKVTKFFESIEELEEGEIGEYQGDSNENFTQGYFYKRGSGQKKPIFIEKEQVTLLKQRDYPTLSQGLYIYQTQMSGELPSVDYPRVNNQLRSVDIYSSAFGISETFTFAAFVFSDDIGIVSDVYLDNFPFARRTLNGYLSPFFKNGVPYPNRFENGVLSVLYDGVWYSFDDTVTAPGGGGFVLYKYDCYMYVDSEHLVQASLFDTRSGNSYYLVNTSITNSIYSGFLSSYAFNLDVTYWSTINIPQIVYDFDLVLHPFSARINTQPPYKSQSLTLTTDTVGNVDTGLTLADIVPLCAYDTNNDVRLMLSVNNAQHIIITPASYSDATTRYPETSFNCVLFYVEVPTA